MVTLASATLWITEQLQWWALIAQSIAIVLSLARRAQPSAWQRSPITLNAGMFGIVGGTILVALRGEPSTIALAHFAALTQGLQLIDARPRRTEFLLVALALFQVVLASNLTDSVFFTPLLIAFTFATIWTLIVHTLHSEAIEAEVDRELPSALTPGLVRTTVIASGLSVLLALVLFVTLPRLRSSVVTGSQIAPSLATAGFSETVAFGELGRIRQDPTVVLRVETLEGEAPSLASAYWRGLAFDRFDGESWSITPPERTLVPGSAEGGVSLSHTPKDYDLVQRVVREPVAAGVLFSVGDVRGLQGSIRRLERDSSGGFYASGQAEERVRYVARTRARSWDDRDLRDDRSALPRREGARYLQLPPIEPGIEDLARGIVEKAESDADRARAIEAHLLTQGRYTDVPPAPDPTDPRSPVEQFLLGDMAGHCEYFASAMVVLAREVGIPARLVNGFAGGQENSIGGFIELTRSDAHAWVEVHYEEAGWVRYDPTPPDLRARAEPAMSLSEQMRELASAVELWWFQRVVGFDRSDQIDALKKAWFAWRGDEGRARTERRRQGNALELDGRDPWREAFLLSLCGLLLLGLGAYLLRARQRGPGLPEHYAGALRLLARHGFERGPSTTARDFAKSLGSDLPAPCVRAFAGLTEDYLAHRFGAAAPGDGSEALAQLRDGLRSMPRAARGSAGFRRAA
jgi:transglutaminase-like putative cysteine protease